MNKRNTIVGNGSYYILILALRIDMTINKVDHSTAILVLFIFLHIEESRPRRH